MDMFERVLFGGLFLVFITTVQGTCSFSRNLEGEWTIEKDGQLLGRMTVGYTRMDVTYMGQVYNYTCAQFDYQQEKYLLRSVTDAKGKACLMFTPFGSADTLMMIRLHMTHIYDDRAFFTPQYLVGAGTMNSVCNNYDDGQILFINYVQ
ncbi:uncharacterized protein LOC134273918 [Saccostrea cucullata]|uniref:uncharacterized protein LOC134273918 n=1 Tax=Saccostrea cuccullata TaxID=36930 RepID=UPI002ED49F08